MTKLFLYSLLFLSFINIKAQAKIIESVATEPLIIAQKITIDSQVYQQHRDLYISLPASYGIESKSYPVLFVLDGDFLFKTGDFISHNLALTYQIDDMIVVGISQKNRHKELKQSGSDQFLEFIKSEVIHFVSENYRTNGFKMLYGHSLGGSFSLYALMNAPDVFDAYVAVSPVINDKGTPDLETLKKFLSENSKKPKYLFLSKGNEKDNYENTIPNLGKFLKQNTSDDLRWIYREYPNKTHSTVTSIAMEDSLSDFFKGRIMPELGELSDFNSIQDIENIGGFENVKNYYSDYNKKIGFNTGMPCIVYSRFAWIYFRNDNYDLLNNLVEEEGKTCDEVNYYLGSSYLYKKDYQRAISLIKVDLKQNPKHTRGWHTLGLAYRDSGDIKNAQIALNKSLELAKNSDLFSEYKKIMDELPKK